MMKKEYMKPDMEVVKIMTTGMLATSSLGMGDPIDDAGGAEAPELPGMPDLGPSLGPDLPGVPSFPF